MLDDTQIQYITVMCCANCIGEKMPINNILSVLRTLTDGFKSYAERTQAYFARSPSGWKIRDI